MDKNKLASIVHVNFIRDYTQKGLEIYCRKQHKLCTPVREDCLNCDMFQGVGQGDVIICEWEDRPPFKGDMRLIPWSDREQELLRVSKMIDDNIISK